MSCGCSRPGSCRNTIERNAAKTSVPRIVRVATREKIDEGGLRLAITVKPIIGNHPPRNDDARPQCKRNHARNARALGWNGVQIPLPHFLVNAGMEQPYVHASRN